MKIKEIVKAYKTLGEANISMLEESEIIKIISARSDMRQHVEKYDAYMQDVKDKFKPEGYDKVLIKAQKWHDLSDDEKIEINKIVKEYETRVNNAMAELNNKEVDINIEKLEKCSAVKILKYNNWLPNKLDEIAIML